MTAIAFLINDACGGLAHCHGLVRDEGEALVVEYQTQDGIAGLIKTEVHEVRIPLKDIGNITLEKNWLGWSTKLVIQLSSMKQVTGLPGMTHGQVKLPITKGDLPAAENLVQSVTAYLNKHTPSDAAPTYST